MSRRAARVDSNHAEIVRSLRQAGCSVLDLSAVGNGCPDLLVSRPTWPHALVLLEVKDGRKPPSARKLTDAQTEFWAQFRGPMHLVTCVADALAAVGIHG